MKIGIVHYSAPPVVGGVESVMLAQARLFTLAGHTVQIIAGEGDEAAFPAGAKMVRIGEMDSNNSEILKASSQLEVGIVPADFDLLATRLEGLLTPVLNDIDITIVHNLFTKHFNLALTAALCRMLEKGNVRRCIAWNHDFTWSSPHSRQSVHPGYPWDLLRTFRPEVTQVVVSEARRDELAALYGCPAEKIQVIYNGVDAEEHLGLSVEGKALVTRLDLLAADLILLMPVRITQAKNIEYAIRVTAEIKARGIEIRTVVTGPPDPHDEKNKEYFESLKDLRKELDVVSNVRFVYESPEHDGQPYSIDSGIVGELYRMADLLFMPSHREGFGMPVLEAGLAGLPVVSTAIPAAQEIGGKDVYLISPDDPPQTTASRILELVSADSSYRLRKKIRQNFTWEAIFRQRILPLVERVENN